MYEHAVRAWTEIEGELGWRLESRVFKLITS